MSESKTIRDISKGKCNKCHQIFAKNAITTHLKSHRGAVSPTGKTTNFFHLLAEGRYIPEYWLHLAVPATCSLLDLDELLRETWLECCSHLSAFTIDGENYSVAPDPEYGDKSADIAVNKVFTPGMKFIHEYDFGTTTELILKVVDEYQGEGTDITILARNEPPLSICMKCREPAVQICTECTWKELSGFLCQAHVKQHNHDAEMFLPVVNSPRMGMCGYNG